MPYKDKKKQSQYQNAVLRKRWRFWLLANGPCRKCASWKNLEVDHIDPKKKSDHRIWSWAEVRRDEELKKCQVLCHKCHQAKTNSYYGFGGWGKWRHGYYLGYDNGCRCTDCRAAHSRRVMDSYKRKKVA